MDAQVARDDVAQGPDHGHHGDVERARPAGGARHNLLGSARELREHELALGLDRGPGAQRLDEQEPPRVGVALQARQ